MKLEDNMASEFTKSKKYYRWSIWCNILLLLFSIGFILTPNIKIHYSIILLILPIISFILREASINHQNCGSKINRLHFLWDGLGYEHSELELKQLALESSDIDRSKPQFVEPYYHSTLPKSSNRLADIIRESAFFTQNISKAVYQFFLIASIATCSILIFILYYLISQGIDSIKGEVVIKCLSISIPFLIAGDFVSLYLKYYLLSNSAGKISTQSDTLYRNPDVSIIEVMAVMDDYNCAIIQCPPLPSLFYSRMRRKLNTIWEKNIRDSDDKQHIKNTSLKGVWYGYYYTYSKGDIVLYNCEWIIKSSVVHSFSIVLKLMDGMEYAGYADIEEQHIVVYLYSNTHKETAFIRFKYLDVTKEKIFKGIFLSFDHDTKIVSGGFLLSATKIDNSKASETLNNCIKRQKNMPILRLKE